jgi:hypothetical protein
MRIECKSCHKHSGEPRAAAGIFTMLPAAVISGVMCAALGRGLGAWVWILGPLLWLVLSWALWKLPLWFASMRYLRRRCPHCGACDWDSPHYSGFGL